MIEDVKNQEGAAREMRRNFNNSDRREIKRDIGKMVRAGSMMLVQHVYDLAYRLTELDGIKSAPNGAATPNGASNPKTTMKSGTSAF